MIIKPYGISGESDILNVEFEGIPVCLTSNKGSKVLQIHVPSSENICLIKDSCHKNFTLTVTPKSISASKSGDDSMILYPKPEDESLVKRIKKGIEAIENSSPWKVDSPRTQTLSNAVIRDDLRKLARLLKTALGEQENEFSPMFRE